MGPAPPNNIRAAGLAGALAGWLVLACAPLAAQERPPEDKLDRVESELQEQRRAAEDLDRSRAALRGEVAAMNQRLIDAAASAQRRESEASALEAEIATLGERIAAAGQDLDAQRAELAELLAALARIARMPPEAALLQPGEPLDGVRSAMLLRRAVPELERRAAQLQGDLEALAKLRGERTRQRETMAAVIAQLATERNRLDGLVAAKRQLLEANDTQLAAARSQADALARQAGNLREIMEEIAAARALAAAVPRPVPKPQTGGSAAPVRGASLSTRPVPAAPARTGKEAFLLDPPPGFGEKSFASRRGALPMPARGRITVAFGGRRGDGQPAQGWTIETRPQAQVIAPFEGRVVYAGPFRGYGLLLILEHGEGYHTLLAGMARIDSVPGQWLLAGEPVGVMGLPEDNQISLYLELRRNGQPIDPDPWLTRDNRKANG